MSFRAEWYRTHVLCFMKMNLLFCILNILFCLGGLGYLSLTCCYLPYFLVTQAVLVYFEVSVTQGLILVLYGNI